MITSLKSLYYFLIYSWKQEVLHGKEFLWRTILLGLNTFTLFLFWIAYSNKNPSINGWTLREISVLYSSAHFVMGWMGMFGAGSRSLIKSYLHGQISRELTDPGYPMFRLLLRGTSLHSGSNIILGLIYFIYSGYANSYTNLLAALIFTLMGAAVMICFFTVINCLFLRIVEFEVFIDQLYDVILLFMIYPRSLFYGFVELLCFTALPVFWMTQTPAELLIQFNTNDFFKMLGTLAFLILLAIASLNFLKHQILTHGD